MANSNSYRGVEHPYPLSSYQKDAVDWMSGSWRRGGSCLVMESCAGSGKSSSIEVMIKYTRRRVLVLVFNKHNQKDLQERLKDYPNVVVKTIHSQGSSALRWTYSIKQDPEQFKYPKMLSGMFEVLKQDKDGRVIPPHIAEAIWPSENTIIIPSNQLLEDAKDDVEIEDGSMDRMAFNAIRKIIDLSRLTLTHDLMGDYDEVYDLIENYGIVATPEIAQLATIVVPQLLRYGRSSIQKGEYDFTDMIWGPNVLDEVKVYQHSLVFVDEAQDLSAAQLGVAMKSQWDYIDRRSGERKRGNTIFVGDTYQAIQGFAGAQSDSMDQIRAATGADDLPLSICYRCSKTQIEYVKSFMPGLTIEARPDAPEGEIVNIKGADFSKAVRTGDLVLCRTTAPLIGKCFSLLKEGKPAKVRGKDIGKQIIGQIKALRKKKPTMEYGELPRMLDEATKISIEAILKTNGGVLDDPRIEAAGDRKSAILFFWEQAENFDCLITLIQKTFEDEDDENVIWLSTVHRAKGLEADRVFILHPEKLPLPCQIEWQFQQEMNLKYVAFTRARYSTFLVKTEK